MSVWTFVINRILISTNTIMMKIKQALLVLCAFCAISSQNLDDIFHVGLEQIGLDWIGDEYMPNDLLKNMESTYKDENLKRTEYKKGGGTKVSNSNTGNTRMDKATQSRSAKKYGDQKIKFD